MVAFKMIIIAHEQTAEVAQPGEGALDFPAVAVATQGPSIVERGLASTAPVRSNQENASLQQSPTQRIAVVSAIGNHSQRTAPRSAPFLRHGDFGQGAFGQFYFRRTGAAQLDSQRNTRAVDHHHPLRAFAPLGFADAAAPFLAGAKLPSRKLSLQSSLWRWSSSERKVRQILSQTPRFSQRRKRRQQVLGLGYSLGKSRQRAPVLSTQRMPSTTRRLSIQGRPRLFSRGKRGSIFFHCSSDRKAFCIPSFSQNLPKSTSRNHLQKLPYETASKHLSFQLSGDYRFAGGLFIPSLKPVRPALLWP